MHKVLRGVLVGGCCMVLAGCSSGPSDSEVESAIKARVNDMGSDGESTITVISAKTQRCSAIQAGAVYTCTVEVEMDGPMGGHMQGTTQFKMVKSDGKWTYDKHQVFSMRASAVP